MQIFISKETDDLVQAFEADDVGLLKAPSGDYYNYMVATNTVKGYGDVVISDGIGRMVPINTEHLGMLIDALSAIYSTMEEHTAANAAAAAFENVLDSDGVIVYEPW